MADNPQTLASIINSLAQTFPELVRQTNRTSVALSILRVVEGGGINVPMAMEADGAIAGSFSEGSNVVDFGSDALATATLGWGRGRSAFKVTSTAAAVAATSHSPTNARNLFEKNIVNSMTKLGSYFNGQCLTGAGTTDNVAGLSSVILRDDNTYGLDRTVGANAFWKSNVFSPGSPTVFTFDLLRKDVETIYVKSGLMPDIALCAPGVHRSIRGLFDSNTRWTREVSTAARGRVMLENTSGVVEIENVQFVQDKDVPAGEILYLNSGVVEIVTLPMPSNFADPLAAPNDYENALLKAFTCYELGRQGSYRALTIEAHLQLRCTRPNACGKRTNVATT